MMFVASARHRLGEREGAVEAPRSRSSRTSNEAVVEKS
jgi:hypothetical protein